MNSIAKHDLPDATQQQHKVDRLTITFYTDPLCCWSWAMQPILSRLSSEFGDSIAWTYRMAGLIPSWENFFDTVNSVNRPLQMGPVWMHASKVSGADIDHTLWFKDPPASSYPACIAFKSVQYQSEKYASTYLGLLWENCMINGINISKETVLINIAKNLKDIYPDFNMSEFEENFIRGKGIELLKADIQEIKNNNIKRLPAMILRQTGKTSLLISGYRPYDYMCEVVQELLNPKNID